MTAEEFFRNKIKEKNPLIEVVTLSTHLITAEEAMLWAYEFSQLEKSEKPIILEISDEEIEKILDNHGYKSYRGYLVEGMKLYREQLKKKQ